MKLLIILAIFATGCAQSPAKEQPSTTPQVNKQVSPLEALQPLFKGFPFRNGTYFPHYREL